MRPVVLPSMFRDYATWLGEAGTGPRSITKYVRIAHRFTEGYAQPKATTSDDLTRWRASLNLAHVRGREPTKAAPSTINVSIAALRSFFAFCLATGIRKDDPMRVSGIKIVKISKRVPKPIARDVLQLVYDAVYADDVTPVVLQDRALLEVLYGSGLRREEAARLTLGQFIGRDQLRVIGKGDKERITMTTPPEIDAVTAWTTAHLGDERTRELVATISVAAAFDDLRRRMPDVHVFYGLRDGGVGKLPMAALNDPGNAVWRRVDAWGQRVKADISAHQFRHCFATHLLSAGASLFEIGVMLGHEDERTTAQYTGLEETMFKRLQALHPRARTLAAA